MEEWEELANWFSDDMIWHKSPKGGAGRRCASCSAPNALFRCLDCSSPSMKCQPCIVAKHQDEVLHIIQVRTVSPMMSTALMTSTHRDGPGYSLPPNPSLTSALCTDSVTMSTNSVRCPQSQPSSPSSTSLVFTPSTSPTASVTRPVPPFCVVLSLCAYGGSLPRGIGRVQHSLSGYSTSSAHSK